MSTISQTDDLTRDMEVGGRASVFLCFLLLRHSPNNGWRQT
jgi:hypothetical protein